MRNILLGVALAACVSGSAWAADQVHKPVVSIDDIQDLAHTGEASVLRQMIETTVVNTGKFRVMERGAQGAGVLLGEQQRAKAGLVTSNTPGKVGGFEGVDFKVYGTITTAGATTTRDSGRSFAMQAGGQFLQRGNGLFGAMGRTMSANSNCGQNAASLAVDVRITDASTGELRYAKEVTQTENGATTCGSSSQVDVNALLRRAAQRISMGLVTLSYPVKVVDVGDDGQILLNYGEGLLANGDVYALLQQGKEIVDPDTGAVLGHKESLIGLVRVVEVTPKFSKATPITPLSMQPTVGAIAREATPEQMRLVKAR